MDVDSQLQLLTVLLAGCIGLIFYKRAEWISVKNEGRRLTGSSEINRYLGLSAMCFAALVLMLFLHRVVHAALQG